MIRENHTTVQGLLRQFLVGQKIHYAQSEQIQCTPLERSMDVSPWMQGHFLPEHNGLAVCKSDRM